MAVTVTYGWGYLRGQRLNDIFTTGDQADPFIGSNGARYFGGWTQNLTPNDSLNGRVVEGRTPVGPDFRVNSTTSGQQFDGSAAGVGDNFVVTFTDFSSDSGGDIRARLFNSSGTPAGADFVVSSSAFDEFDTDVAAADGGFVVTWTRDMDGDGQDLHLYAQRYEANGTKRGGVLIVENQTSILGSAPSVAGLANGGFVVAWQQEAAGGNGDTEVRFNRFYSDGRSAGTVVFDTAGVVNEDVHVVGLPDGGFAVAYTDSGWNISGTEVTLKIFNEDGSARTGFIRVNQGTTGDQDKPSITVLENGFVVVGFSDGGRHLAQAFTPAGEAVRGNVTVASATAIEGESAGLDGGHLATVFSSTSPDDGGDNSVHSVLLELYRRVAGDGAHNTVRGDALNDDMTGGGGNDTLLGGPGQRTDDATFTGFSNQYQMLRNLDGTIRVRDTVAGRDGFDTLSSVEYLHFADVLLKPEDVTLVTGYSLGSAQAAGTPFLATQGWSSQNGFPRRVADVNGDQFDDIVGFGNAGVIVSLGRGDGTFGPQQLARNQFGAAASAGSWTSNNDFPRQLADVNGDGRADVVGFGSSATYVSLATAAGGFSPMQLASADFGKADGYTTDNATPRRLGDVNGDGHADVVAFHGNGVRIALGKADGTFGPTVYKLFDFGSSAGGWTSQAATPREVADVNGDGLADIVGFGNSAVFVSLAKADGTFAPKFLASTQFAANTGWTSNDTTPRQLFDANGDGRADIIGFGNNGTFVSLARANGTFGPMTLAHAEFGAGTGWTSFDSNPRAIADLDGDGAADVIGFGNTNAFVSLSTETGLQPPAPASPQPATAAPDEDWEWLEDSPATEPPMPQATDEAAQAIGPAGLSDFIV